MKPSDSPCNIASPPFFKEVFPTIGLYVLSVIKVDSHPVWYHITLDMPWSNPYWFSPICLIQLQAYFQVTFLLQSLGENSVQPVEGLLGWSQHKICVPVWFQNLPQY